MGDEYLGLVHRTISFPLCIFEDFNNKKKPRSYPDILMMVLGGYYIQLSLPLVKKQPQKCVLKLWFDFIFLEHLGEKGGWPF